MATSIRTPAATPDFSAPRRSQAVFKYPRDVVAAVISRRDAVTPTGICPHPLAGSSRDAAIVLGDDSSSSDSSSDEEAGPSAQYISRDGVERGGQALPMAGMLRQTDTNVQGAPPRSSESHWDGEQGTPNGTKDAPCSRLLSTPDRSAHFSATDDGRTSSRPVAEPFPAVTGQGGQSTEVARSGDGPLRRVRFATEETSSVPSTKIDPPMRERHIRLLPSRGQAAEGGMSRHRRVLSLKSSRTVPPRAKSFDPLREELSEELSGQSASDNEHELAGRHRVVASVLAKRRRKRLARGDGRWQQTRYRIPKGEYEVERIVEQCNELYWIKWKGYPASENTWEPRAHLTNCPRSLRTFRRRQQAIARKSVRSSGFLLEQH